MKQPLDPEGWPLGMPEVFIDLNAGNLNPDGAVVDAEGCLWNAQWGASRVACYGQDGAFLRAVEVGATQSSCPAFGGPDLNQLFVTTAAEGLPADSDPLKGQVFVSKMDITGQPEHQVKV
ncbi:MAG: SMP-30/gluconolactonase/LRE family protein, partial [Pseudomonadota bacterium]|nr:SMP-30/gluconolactonase/LRE family protein [Pseudomonadota bacterium]